MPSRDQEREREVPPRQGSTRGKDLPEDAVLLTDGECHLRSVWLVLPVPVSSSTKQACVVEVDQGFPQKTNAPERQVRKQTECASLGGGADPLEQEASVLSGDLC